LGGTVELPGAPWSTDFDPDEAASRPPFEGQWRLAPGAVEQVFTHFSLRLSVYVAQLAGDPPAGEGCFWAHRDEIDGMALSSVMRKAVAHALSFVDARVLLSEADAQ